jgi:hypothetical protein
LAEIDAQGPLMSAADTAGRSLLSEALHWALPRLAIYVLAAVGSVLAFTIWAAIYTYVWPGMPAATSIEIPAPPPVSVPASPAPAPPIVVPDPAPAVAQVPGDRIPEGLPMAPYVYNVNSDKVGKIAAVLLGNDRKVDVYILAVGDWFLDGSEKVIAVPSQKMTWVKEQNYETKQYEWTAVVSMTKVDVQNAPKQIFDFDAKKWVPAQ